MSHRVAGIVLVAHGLLAACAGDAALPIPLPDLDGTESQVVERIDESASRVRRQPDSAEAWGHLGNVLDAHGFYGEAASCYRRALQLDPEDFSSTYHLAIVLEQEAGDFEEIFALFDKAASLRPDFPLVPYRQGEALSRRGDNAQARGYLERAVALDDGFAAGHRGLGQLLLLLGDAPLAVEHLERAVSLKPNDGTALAALSQAYMLAGDSERARQAAERSRGLKPMPRVPDPVRAEVNALNTSATAVAARARLAMSSGRYEEAIELFRQSLEWKPGSTNVHYNLGVCFLETGRSDLAAEHFREAISIGDDAEAHWRLALLLLDRGEKERGLLHLRRAADRAPDDGLLFAQVATAMSRAGAPEEALALFERAVELGSDSAGLQNNWGAALLQLGRDEDALARFRRGTELDTAHLNSRLNAGRALENLGRKDAATQVYRDAIPYDSGGLARQRLDALKR